MPLHRLQAHVLFFFFFDSKYCNHVSSLTTIWARNLLFSSASNHARNTEANIFSWSLCESVSCRMTRSSILHTLPPLASSWTDNCFKVTRLSAIFMLFTASTTASLCAECGVQTGDESRISACPPVLHQYLDQRLNVLRSTASLS
jgi:hypothetical protein